MPVARAWACSFRSAEMADVTLCASFKCPLREGCERAYDGRPVAFKQSWAVFEWRDTSSGAACQHFVPRKEKK